MNDRGARSAVVVAAGILTSRVVGLLRQTVFAYYLGSTNEADAYNAAVKIPNALRNLLGEGTLGAAFIPEYSRLVERDERAARALANALLGLLLAAVSVLTIIGIVSAPVLARVFAPGFDAEKLALTTRLVRVLFPMSGLMVLSGWCLGVQNGHRRFFLAYASAALWSIAQIVLLVGWGRHAPTLETLAWWLAWATLAGAVLQVGAQLPEVSKLLGGIRPTFDRNAGGVRPVLRNVVPVVVAVGVVQISSFVDQQIASFLPEGAVTNLGFGSLLALLPVALFGVSVAAASLPDLSRDSLEATHDVLRERVRSGWQRILFYIVPSGIALAAYGDYCNGIIYLGGRFGPEQQRIVHLILAAYAIGLVSFASVKLLASAFYALGDYRTPLRASLASLFMSAAIASAIAIPMRESVYAAAGIALGSAIGSYTNFAVLTNRLRSRIGALYTPTMWRGTWRIVIAGSIALAVTLPLRMVFDPLRPRLFGPPLLAAFGLLYLGTAWWLGSGEAARLLRLAPRKRT